MSDNGFAELFAKAVWPGKAEDYAGYRCIASGWYAAGKEAGLERAAEIATDYEGDQRIEPASTRLRLCRKISAAIREEIKKP